MQSNRRESERSWAAENREFKVFRADLTHFVEEKIRKIQAGTAGSKDVEQLAERCDKIEEELSSFITLQLEKHDSDSTYKSALEARLAKIE